MLTLYRIGFCSVSKVAPLQCEQELMSCCGAKIVLKGSQCAVIQFTMLPFDLKRSFMSTRFRCIFCSDLTRTVSKHIRYRTFHFQQRSGAVLFRSRNCFESSVPGVNRSPIQYTFCNTPFPYPVQCEHHLNLLA